MSLQLADRSSLLGKYLANERLSSKKKKNPKTNKQTNQDGWYLKNESQAYPLASPHISAHSLTGTHTNAPTPTRAGAWAHTGRSHRVSG